MQRQKRTRPQNDLAPLWLALVGSTFQLFACGEQVAPEGTPAVTAPQAAGRTEDMHAVDAGIDAGARSDADVGPANEHLPGSLVLTELAPLPDEQHCFPLEMQAMSTVELTDAHADAGELRHDAGAETKLRRLAAPTLLSETGCFEDTATLTVAAGIFRYEMNSPLWTDGAIKQRFVALPPGKQIQIGADGLWDFPIGSVLIKNFIVEFKVGNPASQRPVETRLAVRAEDRWHFYSYAWTKDASDALLLEPDEWRLESLAVTKDEQAAPLDYLFPSEQSCQTCHGTDDRGVVGPRTSQLNRAVNYGGKLMNQLDALDAIGAFAGGLPAPGSELPRVPDPSDESAPLEARARSYLDANCGHCHQPGGWVPAELEMDLRFDTPFKESATCNASALYGTAAFTSQLISAGKKEQSAIWQRMQDLGLSRMPMLGTLVIDPAANVVGEWIDSLEGCPPAE